jgi:two-component system, NtrC family, sensor kinase
MAFRLKIILGMALLHGVLLFGVIVLGLGFLRTSNESALADHAAATATLLATAGKDAVLSSDLATLESLGRAALANEGLAYVRFRGLQGVLVQHGDPHEAADETADEAADGVFDAYADVTEAGMVFGRVEIGYSTELVEAVLRTALRGIAPLVALAVLVTVIFSLAFGTVVTRRLLSLRNAAERVASGDLEHEVAVKGRDELAQLARAFNEMVTRLRAAARQTLQQQRALEQLNVSLEQRVEERTAELVAANAALQHEIAERQRAEEAELTHALRLGTLGELASGLAHELNQPLGAISNYSHASLRRLESAGGAPDLRETLQEICTQSQRAAEIIRHLGDLVRKEAPERVSVDVSAAVRAVARLLQADAARAGVRVVLELEETIPPVLANQVQVEQVLLNLMRNGIESIAGAECPERVLTVKANARDGAMVEISVCDTGPGVPETIRPRLFESFITSKQHGMGVGLSISHTIVQRHGGRLWLEPRRERGACFRFTLPARVEWGGVREADKTLSH